MNVHDIKAILDRLGWVGGRTMPRLLVSAVLALSAVAAVAEPAPVTPTTPGAYVEALGTADAFLDAWVSRDADSGVKLLATSLRSVPRGNSPKDYDSWLQLYFHGLSNPYHAGFEIGKGNLLGRNRAVFPVTLFEAITGEPAFRYSSSVELIREGESWRVSKLPKSSDNNEE